MSYTKNKIKNSKRATVTFQPSEELGLFIETEVVSGRFQNQSEVVRAGLRLLQEQEANSKLQQLKRMIAEGKNSPVIAGWTKEKFLSGVNKKMNVRK